MKIAECNEFVLPALDGVANVVLAYSTTLAKKGNEVYAIAPLYDTGYRGSLPFEIVDFTSMKISKKFPWRLGIEAIDAHFAERINMIDLDLVHVHSPGIAGLVGIKVARKKHIPVIGSFHTKYYEDFLKITHLKYISSLGARVVADFYKHCDEVWAVSEDAAKSLRKYGYKGEIQIMPNGTNVRSLNTSRIDEIANRYGIRRDIPVLLFVGQINWKKNLECILRACAKLKESNTDFQLVFAGLGPDDKAVKNLAIKLGLEDNFVMTGHIYDTESLDILYHLATLFLFPSIYDTSSLVIREAAAMGTPCVVVEGCGPSEVVQDGVNSFTCKNDPNDLALKVKSYLQMTKREKNKIKEQAKKTIPIPWDGPLMDKVLERYQYVIDNYQDRRKK